MTVILSKSTYRDITEEQKNLNPYAKLVPGQTIVEIPSFELECGETLTNFPVAFKTWGRLNKDKDNVLIICHALTGSSDVQDWWGPLLGTNKTFDPSRFFIICINFLGSPYGSSSPVTIDSSTGKLFGPNFPLITVKDDVYIQKLILDSLGVKGIACVIGGSMGGMMALEYSTIYRDTPYVKSAIALATSARASAWCISWNETQRQCIFSDPNYYDGYYYEREDGAKPDSGLSAARMAALLTYRSRNSFETRFGRKLPSQKDLQKSAKPSEGKAAVSKNEDDNSLLHNDGSRFSSRSSSVSLQPKAPQTNFTAQSYLRYQGSKFINRFDANCYISITRKLDTHDITRGNVSDADIIDDPLPDFLSELKVPHLVIGIESDGLFTYGEQQFLGKHLPNCTFEKIQSPEGHDAFLLEFEIIDGYCQKFLHENIPEFFDPAANKIELFEDWASYVESSDNGGNSVFGEAEKNITNW
ncbi:Piso0_005121 [Millerozyma farinosa CBS 7064]|uniref:Piso0_005121 protein n=1 Tax=Pichia sorbitophila (strain ATCC MYA-4447 / BCRC 22081 / CBS 7064 / NBRC 10061 / NRRL Y-12695) TaxID=559304 RepID=G8Y4A2_PICSO|nr:Piso0_005121 [Millerozyma farinosa CBS 7064]